MSNSSPFDSTVSKQPRVIGIVLDWDGTCGPEGEFKTAAVEAAKIFGKSMVSTRKHLEDIFTHAKQMPAYQRPPFLENGVWNDNWLVTTVFYHLITDGQLPLNRQAVEHIGYNIPTFDGFEAQIVKLGLEIIEKSDGGARPVVAINSCGWRLPLQIKGEQVNKLWRESLVAKGRNPNDFGDLIVAVNGQPFIFGTEFGVQWSGQPVDHEDKAHFLQAFMQNYGVKPRDVAYLSDGLTDLPTIGANNLGLNLQLFQSGNPAAHDKINDVWLSARETYPHHQHALAAADWTEHGEVERAMTQWLDSLRLDQTADRNIEDSGTMSLTL